MPYEIRKVKRGYKLCKVNEDKCFSKKPIPKKRAEAQLRAIGMRGGGSPTFDEYLKTNYPDFANLQMQGTRQVGNNSWETIVKEGDKKFFDNEAYDKLIKGAMTRKEWEELKKIRGDRMQGSYDEYIKQVEDISRARSTRNLSAEERSSMDKTNMNTKNEIYQQYLEQYPDMQKVMCNVKGEDRVAPYETTMGQCKEEHKKYDRRGVFGKITGTLTDVADWAVDNIADKLPLVGQIAGEVYKNFAPPTSQYYSGGGISPKNKKEKLKGSGKMDFKTYLKEVQKVSPIKYMRMVKENGTKNGYDMSKLKWATDGKHKFTYNGVGFGAVGYGDFLLWKLKEGDKVAEVKRRNYRKRAERVMTETNDKFSPASLSYYILW